jgi:hypothetical protein
MVDVEGDGAALRMLIETEVIRQQRIQMAMAKS